jgi:hypothetical protein
MTIGFTPDQIDPSASTREVPFKWVVVVDTALPVGRAVNAAACVAAATPGQVAGLLGEDAKDADGTSHPGLPWIGCTVLGADAARLTDLRRQAQLRDDVALVDMPTQAQHTRVYEDYLLGVSQVRGADLSYCAVGLFGPRRVIDRLVKGLGLR